MQEWFASSLLRVPHFYFLQKHAKLYEIKKKKVCKQRERKEQIKYVKLIRVKFAVKN